MTGNSATMGQTKMCAALSLASREEEDIPKTVSETIEHIWSLFYPSAHEKYRIIPHALVSHCSAPMNVIRKEEVLPLFINHLNIQGQEEIFCCNKEIPCIDVSKEVALLTEKYLPEGSMYHYGKEYYQFARLFFNKRIHCCEQNDEKESKKSREERVEQVKANTPVEEGDQGEQDHDMSIEEIEIELKRYEGDDEQTFSMRQAKNLAVLGAFEEKVDHNMSLDDQVGELIKRQKTQRMEAEVLKAVDSINQQLREISDTGRGEKPLELITPTFSSTINSNPSVTPTAPPMGRIFDCPIVTALYNQAINLITTHKDDNLDYQALGRLISSFPEIQVEVKGEVQGKRGKKNGQAKGTQDFLEKNLIKILYNQSISDQITQLEESYVVLEDNSANELETMTTYRETEAFKVDNERLREGPSLLTFSQNLITEAILDRKKAIVVGATDIYRKIYVSKPRYYGCEFLNMSPPFFMRYSDKIDESNQLFMYLREIVGQLGNQNQKIPILVEYYCSNYGQETFEEFLEHCTNFMQTLAEVQKGYAGRIVCVGPPPFYEKGTSLADYQEAKKSMRKVSESLSLIGYALDIYVMNPLVASLPVYHPVYPSVVGYICGEEFRPFPLFNKEGEPTSEACIRAYRGIKTDLRRLKKWL